MYAGYKHALATGPVAKADRAVLFNCAADRKHPLPDAGTALDRHGPIDYARL